MQNARHIPPLRRARMPVRCLVTGVGLVLAITASGCSSGVEHASSSSPLLSGDRGQPVVVERLSPATHLADRFAHAYARTLYRRRPPRLPGVTSALARELAAAATRVPTARRGLRPRALSVSLQRRDARTLAGTVEIGDGRSPPFSVGFLVELRGSRWRVVSISSPG